MEEAGAKEINDARGTGERVLEKVRETNREKMRKRSKVGVKGVGKFERGNRKGSD